MRLPDSYEAMFQHAVQVIDAEDLAPADAEFRRLVDRLLSLSPELLQRNERLSSILLEAASRWITVLRWDGRPGEALEQINRLNDALPTAAPFWQVDQALAWIDSGQVSKGLDTLRALLMQASEGRHAFQIVLSRELWGAGLLEEAETVARSALRTAKEPPEVLESGLLLLALSAEQDHADAMIAYWQQVLQKAKTDVFMYPVYEHLAALGHWNELEALLENEKSRSVRQFFVGEIARARGDGERAIEAWDEVAHGTEKPDSDAERLVWLNAELMLQHPDGVIELSQSSLRDAPTESGMFLMLIAAMGQSERLDDAEKLLRMGLKYSRLSRPRWDLYPHAYWLRLQRYPIQQESLETLRHYFVQLEAE